MQNKKYCFVSHVNAQRAENIKIKRTVLQFLLSINHFNEAKCPTVQLDVLNARENRSCSAPGSCQATGGPESHRVTAGYHSVMIMTFIQTLGFNLSLWKLNDYSICGHTCFPTLEAASDNDRFCAKRHPIIHFSTMPPGLVYIPSRAEVLITC